VPARLPFVEEEESRFDATVDVTVGAELKLGEDRVDVLLHRSFGQKERNRNGRIAAAFS